MSDGRGARRRLEALDTYWFGPVSAWPLAVFRIVYTLVLVAYFTDRIVYLDEFLGNSAARLPNLHMGPDSVLGFIQPFYVPPLPDWAVRLAVLGFYAASLSLIVGYRARLAAGLLAVWCAGSLFLDYFGAFSINRSSALVFLVLAFSPSARMLSVDAWLRARRGQSPSESQQVSAWSIRTLQWFVTIWYVLAGSAKTRGSWNLFAGGDVLYAQLQGHYMNDSALWALDHLPLAAFVAFEFTTLIFEIGAPLWLHAWQVRWLGFMIGIGMHVCVAILLTKLWFFSAQMIAFYVLFLPLWLPVYGRWPRHVPGTAGGDP